MSGNYGVRQSVARDPYTQLPIVLLTITLFSAAPSYREKESLQRSLLRTQAARRFDFVSSHLTTVTMRLRLSHNANDGNFPFALIHPTTTPKVSGRIAAYQGN